MSGPAAAAQPPAAAEFLQRAVRLAEQSAGWTGDYMAGGDLPALVEALVWALVAVAVELGVPLPPPPPPAAGDAAVTS